jgi:hypothetical protein
MEGEDIWENAHLLPEEYSSSSTYFKLDELTPSVSHNRRSSATKRTFADPEWKAAWYERRWGRKVKSKQTKKQRSLEERMSLPHMDRFLSNSKLSAMDEEQIAEAIRTYLTANQKRASGRSQTLQRRKEALREPVEVDTNGGSQPVVLAPLVSRDSLFEPDPKLLEEQRLRRAEKAVKVYQRRLENRKEITKRKRTKNIALPLSQAPTPSNALKRIERMLDEQEEAAIHSDLRHLSDIEDDLKLVLEPAKLLHRKDLFRRILGEVFDLRGKCVPQMDCEDGSGLQYMFVTKCSISVLGAFVLQKIGERKKVLLMDGN